eukprot:171211-Hanusia_phi.AAC.1
MIGRPGRGRDLSAGYCLSSDRTGVIGPYGTVTGRGRYYPPVLNRTTVQLRPPGPGAAGGSAASERGRFKMASGERQTVRSGRPETGAPVGKPGPVRSSSR